MSSTVQDLPEQGEIVLATIKKITDHGAYVSLDEYGDVQGFLHISEIAPGWIRAVNKYVKEGEKKVLLVKTVHPERGDIDLSLKQVSNDQKKKKLLEVKKYDKGKAFLQSVKEKTGISDKEIDELEETLFSKFDSPYDAFMEIARKGITELKGIKIPKKTLNAIQEICEKIRLPSVEIRGILELTCNTSDGVNVIKKILSDQIEKGENAVEITYLGAPKYRLSLKAPDFKTAEKSIKPILEDVQKLIEKSKGSFKFTREESKKTREN